MKLEDFQEQANEKLEEILELVNDNLKQTGNNVSECQRTFLNQKISAVYGTQSEDMN